jgi:hypothetical protein
LVQFVLVNTSSAAEGGPVAQTLSDRAQRFLQTLERRPHVSDLRLVRAAIEEAGLPVTQPVLDFHQTFAGYLVDVWGEYGPLGIIHPEIVAVESWFMPMKVGGYITAEPPSLSCADVHISYEMTIDLDGTFHCNGPESSSYFLWTEQCAYLWEFCMTRPWRRLQFVAKTANVAAVLASRLASYRIGDLSDQYGEVFGSERFVVSVARDGRRCDAVIAEGDIPEEFSGLPLREPPGG